MREKVTTAAIVVGTSLVVASLIMSYVWGWFGVVAVLTLSGLGATSVVYGLLKGYEHYVGIQTRYGMHHLRGRSSYPGIQPGIAQGRTVPVQRHVAQLGSQNAGNGDARTFSDLIKSRTIGPGLPMVTGYDSTGQAITTTKPRTMGIGGVTGSGKTVTTLNTILSQIVFSDGNIRFLVVDPHMFADTGEELVTLMDSLWQFFLTTEEVRTTVSPNNHAYLAQLDHMDRLAVSNPLEGKEPLLEWVKVLRYELDERIHGKKGAQWVVVIDEFSSVMQDKAVAKELATILEKLAEEARKVGITLILIGQVWKATRTGGTELRDTLPEFKAHRMPENWAKLVVPSDIAKKVARLATGEAIVYVDGVDTKVTVPYTTEEDAVYVANRYHVPFNAPTIKIEEVDEVLEIEPPKSKRRAKV